MSVYRQSRDLFKQALDERGHKGVVHQVLSPRAQELKALLQPRPSGELKFQGLGNVPLPDQPTLKLLRDIGCDHRLEVFEIIDKRHPVKESCLYGKAYGLRLMNSVKPIGGDKQEILGFYVGEVLHVSEVSVDTRVDMSDFSLDFWDLTPYIRPNAKIPSWVELDDYAGARGAPRRPISPLGFLVCADFYRNRLSFINDCRTVSLLAHRGERCPNCMFKQVSVNGWPEIILTTIKGVVIQPGEELVTSLGEGWFRSVEAVFKYQVLKVIAEHHECEFDLSKFDASTMLPPIQYTSACGLCRRNIGDRHNKYKYENKYNLNNIISPKVRMDNSGVSVKIYNNNDNININNRYENNRTHTRANTQPNKHINNNNNILNNNINNNNNTQTSVFEEYELMRSAAQLFFSFGNTNWKENTNTQNTQCIDNNNDTHTHTHTHKYTHK
eukprot:GHVR01108952.1.p1 GENE.GHVR01108952.1~~GHVR01108952.1.p1  ORF type:complete len:441 (-),score=152.29 GHVR01108952.1:269-1591(-)